MASLFSVSDIIQVGYLALKAYRTWHNAGIEYLEIADSLLCFSTSVERIAGRAEEDSSLLDIEELDNVLQGSHETISELESICFRYSNMGAPKRFAFRTKDLEPLRKSLADHQSRITFYLQTVQCDSLRRIESHNATTHVMLREIKTQLRGLQRSGTLVSKHNTINPSAFKLLEKEMIGAGLTSDMIERYAPQLMQEVSKLAAKEQERASIHEYEEGTEASSVDSEAEDAIDDRRYSWQSDEASIQGETEESVEQASTKSYTVAKASDRWHAWQPGVQDQVDRGAESFLEVTETVHKALDLSVLKGLEVQYNGYIVDAEGNCIGQLTEGHPKDLQVYPIGDDGEIIDEDGDLVGRVKLLRNVIKKQFQGSSIEGIQIHEQHVSVLKQARPRERAHGAIAQASLQLHEHGQRLDRYGNVLQQGIVFQHRKERMEGSSPSTSYSSNDDADEEHSSESEQGSDDTYEDDQRASRDVREETYVKAENQRSRSFWKGSWRKKRGQGSNAESQFSGAGFDASEVEDEMERAWYSNSERNPDYFYEDEEPSDEVVYQATSVGVANERPRSFWKRSWGRTRAAGSTAESHLQGPGESDSYSFDDQTHHEWTLDFEKHVGYYYEGTSLHDESIYEQSYDGSEKHADYYYEDTQLQDESIHHEQTYGGFEEHDDCYYEETPLQHESIHYEQTDEHSDEQVEYSEEHVEYHYEDMQLQEENIYYEQTHEESEQHASYYHEDTDETDETIHQQTY